MSAGLGRIFPCRSTSIRTTASTTTQRFTRTQHVHVHTHRRHAGLASTHVRPSGTAARTSTPTGAKVSSHTPFTAFSTSYKPTSPLREAFDAPAASSSRSRYAAASTSAPDGLFLYPNLRTPDTFLDSVNAAIARGHLLVERIANAPANGDEEMRKVIKLFDRLSDVLCKVIDAAEVVRCLHPDTHWRQGAERVYEELFSWMNTLNTDPRLYEVKTGKPRLHSSVIDLPTWTGSLTIFSAINPFLKMTRSFEQYSTPPASRNNSRRQNARSPLSSCATLKSLESISRTPSAQNLFSCRTKLWGSEETLCTTRPHRDQDPHISW